MVPVDASSPVALIAALIGLLVNAVSLLVAAAWVGQQIGEIKTDIAWLKQRAAQRRK